MTPELTLAAGRATLRRSLRGRGWPREPRDGATASVHERATRRPPSGSSARRVRARGITRVLSREGAIATTGTGGCSARKTRARVRAGREKGELSRFAEGVVRRASRARSAGKIARARTRERVSLRRDTDLPRTVVALSVTTARSTGWGESRRATETPLSALSQHPYARPPARSTIRPPVRPAVHPQPPPPSDARLPFSLFQPLCPCDGILLPLLLVYLLPLQFSPFRPRFHPALSSSFFFSRVSSCNFSRLALLSRAITVILNNLTLHRGMVLAYR